MRFAAIHTTAAAASDLRRPGTDLSTSRGCRAGRRPPSRRCRRPPCRWCRPLSAASWSWSQSVKRRSIQRFVITEKAPTRGFLHDCEIFGNLGLKLYLEPGPQVALQPPQLPHTDHWHASPGNGEQKSQSPLQHYRYLKNHSNNGIAEEFLVDINPIFYQYIPHYKREYHQIF